MMREEILRYKQQTQAARKINEDEKASLLLAHITELIGHYRVCKDPLLLAEMIDCVKNISPQEDLEDLIKQLIENKGEIINYADKKQTDNTHQEALFANISVKAVIYKNGKILAVQKQEAFGGGWETPGGRLSENSIPKHVVAEEVYEELGIEKACVGRIIGSSIAEPLLGFTNMYYELFETKIPHTNITLSEEHQAYQWLNKQELKQMVESKQFNTAIGNILLKEWDTLA